MRARVVAAVIVATSAGFSAGLGRPTVDKLITRAYYRWLARRVDADEANCQSSGAYVAPATDTDFTLVTCPSCQLPVMTRAVSVGDVQVLVLVEHGG